MKKLLASVLVASSCFAMKSGIYVGAWGGGNLGVSNQTIDFYGTNLGNVNNGASGAWTQTGSYNKNGSVSKNNVSFSYSTGLRLGYVHTFTQNQALRTYGTLGVGQISVGVKDKNSIPHFSPQTYNLYQIGLALDYMLEFAGGFGMFIGLGYEHGFGDFAKQSYAKNAQPYGNVGFFSELGSGLSIELGTKLPFLSYFQGEPKVNRKYVFFTNVAAVEVSKHQEKNSTRAFQIYLALNYVL